MLFDGGYSWSQSFDDSHPRVVRCNSCFSSSHTMAPRSTSTVALFVSFRRRQTTAMTTKTMTATTTMTKTTSRRRRRKTTRKGCENHANPSKNVSKQPENKPKTPRTRFENRRKWFGNAAKRSEKLPRSIGPVIHWCSFKSSICKVNQKIKKCSKTIENVEVPLYFRKNRLFGDIIYLLVYLEKFRF